MINRMERKTCTWIAISVFLLLIIVSVILVYFYVFSNARSLKPGPKLIIDHDGGADDAMALFLGLLYEEYFDGPPIIALTTGHGNVNESQVFENTQRILDIAKRRDVPIYRGSNFSLVATYSSDFYYGYDGLGDLEDVHFNRIAAQPEHAVNALIELSKKYEGELTVLVLGAVTNIALVMRMDPNFISRLAHLYIAAGNIYSETSPKPEFNALVDVEGYHVVAENATPERVTFIPFSPLLASHNISVEWRMNTLGAIDTEIMRNLNKFERISIVGATSWNQLDPPALAMVLNNELVEKSVCSDNSIILCGDRRGVNTNNFTDCSESNIKIAYPAPEDAFKNFLYTVFSAELHRN